MENIFRVFNEFNSIMSSIKISIAWKLISFYRVKVEEDAARVNYYPRKLRENNPIILV